MALSANSLFLLLSVGLLSLVANHHGVFSSLPPLNSQQSRDDMIFMLGRWFYKNGEPKLTFQSTPAQRFPNCVDHFNSSGCGCEAKYEQRYWVNEDFFTGDGPVFFMFGGEASASGLIDAYYWTNYARKYNALLIVLEHRFYGDSFPSTEETIEAYKLLTSQQALADAAYFIDEYKQSKGLQNHRWVGFGCSYAGNLVAWFKQKYPNHLKTVVASSAPIVAMYDFPGYMETVSDVVKEIDWECYNRVYDAFNCMESLVNGSSCGVYNSTSQIMPALRQCHKIDWEDDLQRESFFQTYAMSDWADNWPSGFIRRSCQKLVGVDATEPLTMYGEFLGPRNCKNSSNSLGSSLEEFTNFLLSEEVKRSGIKEWYWQTCNEFGYYMSSDPKHGLFGYNTFSGDPFGVACLKYFGPEFTREYVEERIRLTNEFYKGRDIDAKCVIWVNGAWDPWHTLSINSPNETTPDNTVIYIPGAEHCADYFPNPQSDEVLKAHERIQKQIELYTNDPSC